MPKSQPFCVLGAVQYEMKEIESRPQEIADWAYMYYSHSIEDQDEEAKLVKKLRLKGCMEEDDKIYLLCKPNDEA